MMKSFIPAKSFTTRHAYAYKYFGTRSKLTTNTNTGQHQHHYQSQQPTIRRRYPILTSMTTQYTINDEVCPPMDPAELKKIVKKHCVSMERFLENKPIARHTQAAFDQIFPFVDSNKKVILDSGCGTARSTILLGEMFPDHTVIGIDRSFVRLSRNALSNKGIQDDEDNDDDNNDDQQSLSMENAPSEESLRPFQAVSSNTLLVRAELTDFWRCCLKSGWDITHHFIYYPNPYPKKNRVKKRFYAHPSFPLILQIGGEISLRSNWEGYLKEFAQSVEYAHDVYDQNFMKDFAVPYLEDAMNGPLERTDKSIAFTNFEKKYDDVGEKTFELKLRRQ